MMCIKAKSKSGGIKKRAKAFAVMTMIAITMVSMIVKILALIWRMIQVVKMVRIMMRLILKSTISIMHEIY